MSTPPDDRSSSSLPQLLVQARRVREASDWPQAISLYAHAAVMAPQSAEVRHNLALSLYGAGRFREAAQPALSALQLNPALWQSRIIVAKIQKALGEFEAADQSYAAVLRQLPDNGTALAGRADLLMNEFGDPLAAAALVKPLWDQPVHRVDAELTTLMASLYDRDSSAQELTAQVMDFSRRALRLPGFVLPARPARSTALRPRVALLSPLFCVSPVYFLTIAGFRHVSRGCDVVVFNRGSRADWATQAFRDLSTEWHDVQHLGAQALAQAIHAADIDVLYDLGGWMDPVGLQALSAQPARKQFKWVGGQSVTTGLDTFDGWIGDAAQSPLPLQHLYSEPLINIDGGYATFTPPSYMPAPVANKRPVPVVFANPAKVSRAFLRWLAQRPGKICFVHRQFRHAQVRQRIDAALGANKAEYVCPGSHQEALEAVNQHALMLDTFPYSGGLTAREARAMGVKVQTRVGELFCERHGAGL